MPLIISSNQHNSYNSARLCRAKTSSFCAMSVDVELWREELDFPATALLREYIYFLLFRKLFKTRKSLFAKKSDKQTCETI